KVQFESFVLWIIGLKFYAIRVARCCTVKHSISILSHETYAKTYESVVTRFPAYSVTEKCL
ncbi:MAG: hypothetical protein ACPGEF_07335, partial [Endozoicomonas sp.]